jgi:hypothetical protein
MGKGSKNGRRKEVVQKVGNRLTDVNPGESPNDEMMSMNFVSTEFY